MTIALNNIGKNNTPRIPFIIGRSLMVVGSTIVPFIAGAEPEVLSAKERFFWSITVSIIVALGTLFTDMFGNKKEKQLN